MNELYFSQLTAGREFAGHAGLYHRGAIKRDANCGKQTICHSALSKLQKCILRPFAYELFNYALACFFKQF